MAICILKPKIYLSRSCPVSVRPGKVRYEPCSNCGTSIFRGPYGPNHNNEEAFRKHGYDL